VVAAWQQAGEAGSERTADLLLHPRPKDHSCATQADQTQEDPAAHGYLPGRLGTGRLSRPVNHDWGLRGGDAFSAAAKSSISNRAVAPAIPAGGYAGGPRVQRTPEAKQERVRMRQDDPLGPSHLPGESIEVLLLEVLLYVR
jgi:hypothetical protein